MQNHRSKRIPDIVVSRLPLYLRALSAMEAQRQAFTSSQELAARLGLSSAQIRKDLSHFGEFGKQGTGYSVVGLQRHLREILNIDREWPIVVIGAGNIGSAVAAYTGFAQRGFRVVAVFDSAASKIGERVGDCVVQDMAELPAVIARHRVRHAMIAVPGAAAQRVTDELVRHGIAAILNYAPVNLTVPEGVHVEYIDPVLHLQTMTYYVG